MNFQDFSKIDKLAHVFNPGIKAPFQHLEESVRSGFWSIIKKLLKDLKKHACAKVSTF
jgi:hypothetical protein